MRRVFACAAVICAILAIRPFVVRGDEPAKPPAKRYAIVIHGGAGTDPAKMTKAEVAVLAAKGLTGVRLSCQILCDHDMTVRAISRLEGSGRPDPGRTPEPFITPPPVWL